MSIAHCMHHAFAIAAMPRREWKDAIAKLPDGCSHPDCGGPRNCRKRIGDYLRMQWRIRARLERQS